MTGFDTTCQTEPATTKHMASWGVFLVYDSVNQDQVFCNADKYVSNARPRGTRPLCSPERRPLGRPSGVMHTLAVGSVQRACAKHVYECNTHLWSTAGETTSRTSPASYCTSEWLSGQIEEVAPVPAPLDKANHEQHCAERSGHIDNNI